MTEPTADVQNEFFEIRKPGAHLEGGVVADDFVIALGVDIVNFPKFPKVDDTITYPKTNLDIRQQLDEDSGLDLDDYSGPYKSDLRFTDFSRAALATKFLPWSEKYMQLCVDGWFNEVGDRYGADTAAEIEWTAWNDQTAPELERMGASSCRRARPTATRTRRSPRARARRRVSSTPACSRTRTTRAN
jgi:hypothetical protein